MKLFDIKNLLSYPVWINEHGKYYDDSILVHNAEDLEEQVCNYHVVYITTDGEGMLTVETSCTAWKVCFIDGHDLKYKEFITHAKTVKDAVDNMYLSYGYSFGHSITSVTRVDA